MATIYKKTTVQFPTSILRGLRQYLLNNDMTSHDQSKVIVIAVENFLEANNIKIPQDEITDPAFEEELRKFCEKFGLDEDNIEKMKSVVARPSSTKEEITTSEVMQQSVSRVSASISEAAEKIAGLAEKH